MQRVLLGLSGGIDSAVSAAVLKKAGYSVTGCFLQLNENADENSPEALSAKRSADSLGIDFIIKDCRESFRKKICAYFVREYLSGLTPNPCVRCNPELKFASLLDCAADTGADCIATGHYALTEHSEEYGGAVLRAASSKKDQSYFLYRLSPAALEKIIFPLGRFGDKNEVRAYGREIGLHNFSAPDSRDVCFIPDGNYAAYIKSCGAALPDRGNFLDMNGNVIGTHSGIINYTVGQRKGLGAFGEPMYVKYINAADNTVTLCRSAERFSDRALLKDFVWTVRRPPEGSLEVLVKVRSTAVPARALALVGGERAELTFYDKVIAPSPGQSAVIYKDDVVLGGGIIV